MSQVPGRWIYIVSCIGAPLRREHERSDPDKDRMHDSPGAVQVLLTLTTLSNTERLSYPSPPSRP